MGQIEISVDLNNEECKVNIKNITEEDHGEWKGVVSNTGTTTQDGKTVKTKYLDDFSQNVTVTGNSKRGSFDYQLTYKIKFIIKRHQIFLLSIDN